MSENFIFGYGSLMSKESRAKTGMTGDAIPVRVKGLQRAWNQVIPNAFVTALGVVFEEEAFCNGVIIPIAESQLPNFDKRESDGGYFRIQLQRDLIDSFGMHLPEGIIWVYITDNPGFPSDQFPLIQSYADVALTGCFEYGEAFAKEFIATTKGWDTSWLNDRTNPRYPRAMKEVPLASVFDALLQSLIPEAFNKRK